MDLGRLAWARAWDGRESLNAMGCVSKPLIFGVKTAMTQGPQHQPMRPPPAPPPGYASAFVLSSPITTHNMNLKKSTTPPGSAVPSKRPVNQLAILVWEVAARANPARSCDLLSQAKAWAKMNTDHNATGLNRHATDTAVKSGVKVFF